MALRTSPRGIVVVKYSLDRFDKTMKKYTDFVKSNGMGDAASYLRDLAYARMYDKFYATKKGYPLDRKSRRRRRRLESVLFPSPPGAGNYPPVEFDGKYAFTIRLIPDLSHVNDSYPRLKWQELGTQTKLHNQAFRFYFTGNRFQSGKRQIAYKNVKERDINQYRGQIARLPVFHFGLKPRLFIKAGMTFLKTEGSKTVLRYIRERLK